MVLTRRAGVGWVLVCAGVCCGRTELDRGGGGSADAGVVGDTQTPDAITDQPRDTPALPADKPAEPPPVAACCRNPATCGVSAEFSFGTWGGITGAKGVSGTVMPPRCFLRPVRDSGGSVAIWPSEIPDCDGGELVGTAAVNRALAHPDVVAALAESKDPLFGGDPRGSDGYVWWFGRADGHGLIVGRDCGGQPGCREIPPGIAVLRETLGMLHKQQLGVTCE